MFCICLSGNKCLEGPINRMLGEQNEMVIDSKGKTQREQVVN